MWIGTATLEQQVGLSDGNLDHTRIASKSTQKSRAPSRTPSRTPSRVPSTVFSFETYEINICFTETFFCVRGISPAKVGTKLGQSWDKLGTNSAVSTVHLQSIRYVCMIYISERSFSIRHKGEQ